MDPNGPFELVQSGAALAAVARLFYLNLARQFPVLLTFVAFVGLIDAAFGFQDSNSRGYYHTWLAVEPVVCILAILAVRELLTLTFADYPGIRTAGRWTMYGAVVFALAISLLLTRFFWARGAAGRANSLRLYFVEISKRSVFLSLAVVIVAILIFLSRYPLRLPHNVLTSSVFFSALFLSEATRLLIDTLTKSASRPVDWTESGFIVLCLVGWAVLLRRTGPPGTERIHYSSVREDHLLRQLNFLNELMAGAARQ
jgi:hypothetical protein